MKNKLAFSMKHSAFGLFLYALCHMLYASSAYACSTCYLNVDTPMTRAAAAGVWVLLLIVVALLSGFFAFMIYLGRRSRRFHGV